MNTWLAEHNLELISGLATFVATAIFHAIWKVATIAADLRRAQKDIDNLAELMGTVKAKDRIRKRRLASRESADPE